MFGVLLVDAESCRRESQDPARVTAARILDEISARLKHLTASAPLIYGAEAGTRTVLRVITTAAPEHDSLAASIAQEMHLPLHRICEESVTTGPTETAERTVVVGADAATAAAIRGLTLVQEVALTFSDLAVVVWDGRTPGPHTLVISEAAVAGKMVLWIDHAGDLRLLDGARLTEVEIHLLRAGEPTVAMLVRLFLPITEVARDELLALIANPAAAASGERLGQGVAEYFAETPELRIFSRLAGRTHHFLERALTRFASAATGKPNANAGTGASIGAVATAVGMDALEARKSWSSARARYAAGVYRDTYWVLWLFAPMAVFAAAANDVRLWFEAHSVAWVAMGLVAMLAVPGLVRLAKRRDWDSRWLKHRFLAEQLRYEKLAYSLLIFLPAFTRASPATPESWLLRRSLISVGVPTIVDGLPFEADACLAERRSSLLGMVGEQLKYHADKCRALVHMERRLESFATAAFLAAALTVAAQLFVHPSWLLLFTATLPAVASAAHGILSSLEVKRVAALSSRSARRLRSLKEALRGVVLEEAAAGAKIRFLTEQAVRVMSDDAEQWRDLLDHHGIELTE